MKRIVVYRDAVTGRFVTDDYARSLPGSTIRQTLAPWRWIKRMQARRVRE